MVSAGVVLEPDEWRYGWYREIQNPKQRYTLIDRQKLSALLGIKKSDQLTQCPYRWIEEVLKTGTNKRDAKWTQSIAIGRRGVKNDEGYEFKEAQSLYSRVFDPEKCGLRPKNDYLWQVPYLKSDT